ncbi:hypothetical protein [Legionella sp. W05-934-2]|uniref:hypothetical protein n=1 Tax=Legionella sp. W05-934-2 TaxID=1198649 RepID=UPI003462BFD1
MPNELNNGKTPEQQQDEMTSQPSPVVSTKSVFAQSPEFKRLKKATSIHEEHIKNEYEKECQFNRSLRANPPSQEGDESVRLQNFPNLIPDIEEQPENLTGALP